MLIDVCLCLDSMYIIKNSCSKVKNYSISKSKTIMTSPLLSQSHMLPQNHHGKGPLLLPEVSVYVTRSMVMFFFFPLLKVQLRNHLCLCPFVSPFFLFKVCLRNQKP